MPRHQTLIDTVSLRGMLDHGEPVVLLDCRFDLADPGAGEAAHACEHIPSARHAHLDRDLAGPCSGTNGRHPLPAMAAWSQTLARWGVTPAHQVVAYDAQGGAFAARAWWLLRWIGHRDAAVLDGGWQAWVDDGGTRSSDAVKPVETQPYPVPPCAAMAAIDADTLLRELGRWQLLDARSGERFRGEAEPIDPVAGHIPGARLRPFQCNLDSGGRFLPRDELARQFRDLGVDPSRVVHQCGSGVTACHNLLAMAHAGLEGSRLYPGSWSEWCADPQRPIATG